MNHPCEGAIEQAVVALLQPVIGYFPDHAVIAREMPIMAWRDRMRGAIGAYMAVKALEQTFPGAAQPALLSAPHEQSET